VDSFFFLKGFVIGFSIAAPVGPIGVLCIRRTIAYGRASGFVSGLGAAVADACYGAVAGFGLTAISSAIIGYQSWLQLFGGLFLCYLGAKTLASQPASKAAELRHHGLLNDFTSTVFLTLTNPATILSFAAVFASFGLGGARSDYFTASLLVFGVFIGSAFWWLLLSSGVGMLRDKFDTGRLLWVNRISGVILAGFGLFALLGLLQ